MSIAALLALLLVPAAASAWSVRPAKAQGAWPITIAAARDVFAAIVLQPRPAEAATAIVKLARADGAELWRRRVRGGGSERSDFIYDLEVAADGDVVAGGSVVDHGHSVFFVARLAGSNGRERWRRMIRGREPPDYEERANAIALDASGDVIAGGEIENATTALFRNTQDLAVVKLAGDTGEERWRFLLNGTADWGDSVTAVAVDGNGDVVVVGRVTNLSPDPFSLGDTVPTVIKLARDDGRLLWRRDVDGLSEWSVVVDGDGDVLIAATATGGAPGATDAVFVGSSRVDLQACKLEYSIVSPK